MWVYGLDWAGPGQRKVADACGCGNEPSGSVKSGEFLDQLQTSQLLKKDSAPWSKQVSNTQTVYRPLFSSRLVSSRALYSLPTGNVFNGLQEKSDWPTKHVGWRTNRAAAEQKKSSFIYLHGSHPFLFITKQTTFIQSNTTQAYFNSTVYPYI